MHLLRAAHQGPDHRSQGQRDGAERRRHQAGLRAVVPGAGARIRRPRRSRERRVAPVGVSTWEQAARRPGDQAGGDVFEQTVMTATGFGPRASGRTLALGYGPSTMDYGVSTIDWRATATEVMCQ